MISTPLLWLTTSPSSFEAVRVRDWSVVVSTVWCAGRRHILFVQGYLGGSRHFPGDLHCAVSPGFQFVPDDSGRHRRPIRPSHPPLQASLSRSLRRYLHPRRPRRVDDRRHGSSHSGLNLLGDGGGGVPPACVGSGRKKEEEEQPQHQQRYAYSDSPPQHQWQRRPSRQVRGRSARRRAGPRALPTRRRAEWRPRRSQVLLPAGPDALLRLDRQRYLHNRRDGHRSSRRPCPPSSA